MLYVDETESLKRQLLRGRKVKTHNEIVQKTGQGQLIRERATDQDEALIRARYKIFTLHFNALMRLKNLFPFHLINAIGPVDEVMRAIWREFEYQSSLELDQKTYDAIHIIPIAQSVGIHARQELVRRLEHYQHSCPQKVYQCVSLIESFFVPSIQRHAVSGIAMVRLDGNQLNDPELVDIILDVLSERGYRASVDCRLIDVPRRVNRETFEIELERTTSYIFDVRFPRHLIRGIFGGDETNPRDFAGTVVTTEEHA